MKPDRLDLALLTSVTEALSLTSDDDGASFSASVSPDFSNGPNSLPPETGFPFGGLLASLAIKAMQTKGEIEVPIRTLSVQFMAAAKYGEPITFEPRLLRAGRNVSYATVLARQGDRVILHASGTFGADADWSEPASELLRPPPALDQMLPAPGIYGPMAPRFTQYIDYRFETGPHILGGNKGRKGMERVWMRLRDGLPLDELRLSFMLDALYPPAMTLTNDYLRMTSVDLRYDFLRPVTENVAPDGWVFFEYSLLEHDFSWSLDDAIVWTAKGVPLALARQRRKVL